MEFLFGLLAGIMAIFLLNEAIVQELASGDRLAMVAFAVVAIMVGTTIWTERNQEK